MKWAHFLLNLALVSGLFTASANGATITWASGTSGNWSNPANWSPSQVPGPSDTATITAKGNYTVTVDTSVTVNGLVLGSSDTTTQTVLLHGQYLAIGQSATVNTNGVISISSGAFGFGPYGGTIMNGKLICSGGTLNGVLTIASNAVANLTGFSASTQAVDFAALILTNYGTVVWSNLDIQCPPPTVIYNYGLWDAKSDNTFYGNSSSSGPTTFNNYGIVRKDGGSTITHFDSNTTFTNSGTVDVETAQINIDTGTGGGLFNTATNAIVWLGMQNGFGLSGDVTFTGPGLVGGNLVGSGVYGDNPAGVIHGALNFYYGSLGGYLTVATNAVANLAGLSGQIPPQPLDLSYLSLTNCGTVIWSNIDLNCNSAQVDNFGLWDALSDNTFYGGSGGVTTTTFNNYGIVRKDGGSTITHFDFNTTFTNSGTVDVETAQINIDTGTGGGLFNTASNAIVWLGMQYGFGLSGDVTFTGPGLVGGNLVGSGVYGNNPAGVIHGSLNFYYGSLGGYLTVASNAVANLSGLGGQIPPQPLDLSYLILTNCGTVIWSNIDLNCSSVQVYNHGLWDALSDNTFYGGTGGATTTTFNNYGIVRKDGGSTITHFDFNTTFTNSGTVDVETAQINIDTGTGGGLFNTAANAIVWLGMQYGFGLSGDVTFAGPGLVGGNLVGGGVYANNTAGVIHGALNFYYGSLGGYLTVASNAVANLSGLGGPIPPQPLGLSYLSLTNCGTVIWSNIDLNCSSVQVYNHGLWDAQSDNTFYGGTGGATTTTFNNYGIVRKDGGSTITHFDNNTTFTNSGTVDVETAQINIDTGTGGGLFNTASNAIVWLGMQYGFGLSGNVTFTGPGLVGGNLVGGGVYANNNAGVIHGSLNFYNGSLGGALTVASNAVANLSGLGGLIPPQPLGLSYLILTNCGTVLWSNIDLNCSSVQVYNHGLWDALSDNTFYGGSAGPTTSTFNNYGIVRKDGGSTITHFDSNTTFTNSGTVDVETAQMNIDMGTGGGRFNTASNAIVSLGMPYGFGLSGNVTFTGPGLVGGNLVGGGVYANNNAGVIQGSLNFYNGSLGGALTVASNAVANLIGLAGPIQPQPLDFSYLILTNCGTIVWSNIDLDCSSAQVYNHGLWDALSGNTFYGNSSGGGSGPSTFNNCGTVRKDGGGITAFDSNTTFNNVGKTDVQKGQVALAGSCSLTNGTLNVGICGPSQFGSIDFPNGVELAGRLSANLRNHYMPAVSNSFPVVVYGSETGAFTSLSLPPLSSGLGWQTNYTSTTFTLSVVVAPALQLSAGLKVSGSSMSLSWYGLLGQTYQVQCTTNLAPANWVDLDGPITGTNGPITVLDSISTNPQDYYRIQSQ